MRGGFSIAGSLIVSPAMDEYVETVREFVRLQTAVGFLDATRIVAEAVEYVGDEWSPQEAEPAAWAVVTEAFTAHGIEQAGWPAVTDNDRLTRAFRELEAAGIVARENFACCRTCGMAEIGAEVTKGQTARSFVFYHAQGAEHGANGQGVTLYYGPLDGSDATPTGVEVVAALTDQGLAPRWSGSGGQGIHVPMQWRRRRSAQAAAFEPNPGDRRILTVEDGDHRTMLDGGYTASRLCALHLPWLATDTTLRVTLGDATMSVHRRWDRLIAELPQRGRAEVGRFDGLRLIDTLAGGELPTSDVPREPGLVEVRTENAPRDIPYSVADALDILRRMPAYGTGFASFTGRSGGCLQTCWENDTDATHPRRLLLESLDIQTATTIGRHVTLDEAETMITVLAVEDRIAVADLGDLQTIHWN